MAKGNNNNNVNNASGSGIGGGNNNQMNIDPSQNPSSPYYVHPGDGPSSVAVTPVLSGSGSNYHSWAQSTRRALGGKNKLEFVDGTIAIPDNFHPSYKAWNRCNMLIHYWIMNSVADSIAQSIVFFENAIDVWEDLRGRFSQGDLVRIADLQSEIYSIKQGSLTVSEFHTVLWKELESYLPPSVCGSPMKCTCQSGVRNAQYQCSKCVAARQQTIGSIIPSFIVPTETTRDIKTK